MAAYGFAVFTGAFFLFQVQPLMAKYLLPWFGGSPGVWTTCMLFFQVLLLGGYAYAHLSSRALKPRAQVVVHLVLLGLALATLPITPNDTWKPRTVGDPTLRIIALLVVSLGLPYFVLSATAPLLQSWFSRSYPGRSPFRLYALSNAGSLLALLSYPAFFETFFTRAVQGTIWGAGLGLYAVGCGWCGLRVWKAQNLPAQDGGANPGKPAATNPLRSQAAPKHAQKLLWVLLPACASVLLLAITNKICQDVAVIAFLWVVPLSVYLLSFIVCFDRPRWYGRLWFGIALLVALWAMCWTLTGRLGLSVPMQILVYTAGLFVCCMVCHGEVYRLKPEPVYLTSFYLAIAAGGALGGVFVAVIAPNIFSDYFELHWGLLLCATLFLVICLLGAKPGTVASTESSELPISRRREGGSPVALSRPEAGPGGLKLEFGAWLTAAQAASGLALIGLAVLLWQDAHRYASIRTYRARNFYGVLNVYRHYYSDPLRSQIELMHGRIVHGMQFLHPSRALWPTLYFSPESGIGRALRTLPPGERRIGVVGLGAGTLAAYAQRGEQVRFYEINPEVEKVARTYFTYLLDSPAEIKVILGDARLSLENEPPQNFDLLALDAFNSDAIPLHLLTREAFEGYQRHLKPSGVLAVHVSNASLNLEPAVLKVAGHCGYQAAIIEQSETDEQRGVLPSIWVILSQNTQVIKSALISEAARPAAETPFKVPLWTDDFSGLFPVLRWRRVFAKEANRPELNPQPAALVPAANVASEMARLREILNHEPNSAVALNNLACLLATAPNPALRDGAEAVKLAERACALSEYRNTVMLSTLAAAYAEAGRFEEAVATGEKACSLAAKSGQRVLLERNQQLLEFYRKKRPYHQGAQ